MEFTNGESNSHTQNNAEKLVGTNHKYWKMRMEAFLQGHHMWKLIAGAKTEIPIESPEKC